MPKDILKLIEGCKEVGRGNQKELPRDKNFASKV